MNRWRLALITALGGVVRDPVRCFTVDADMVRPDDLRIGYGAPSITDLIADGSPMRRLPGAPRTSL